MKPRRDQHLPGYGEFVRLARRGMHAEESDVSTEETRAIAKRTIDAWVEAPAAVRLHREADSMFVLFERALPAAAAAAVALCVLAFVATRDPEAELEDLAEQLAEFGHSGNNGDLL